MISYTLKAMLLRAAAQTVRIGLLAFQAFSLIEIVELRLAVLANRVIVALKTSLEHITAFGA